MDNGVAEGAAKDIPAQPETVGKIKSQVKKLIGIRYSKSFRTEDPDSGKETQIEFSNVSVYPMYHRRLQGKSKHYRDQDRLGRTIYIDVDETDSVLNDGGDPDTLITPMRFRLDTTLLKSPKLFISTEDQTAYLKSQRDQHSAKLAEHFRLPEDQQWREPTEAEAQELYAQITGLNKTQQLQHKWADRTQGQDSEHASFRNKLEQEATRIFSTANDSVVRENGRESIRLSLGEKTVFLTREQRGGVIHVDIEEIDESSGGAQTVRESYTSSLKFMPITHVTYFKRDIMEPGTQTPSQDLDQDQANYLFTALETLSDERIRTELARRKQFISNIERIINRDGVPDKSTDGRSISKTFEYNTSDITVRKLLSSPDDPSASYLVDIDNYVDEDHPENEDDIKSQFFRVHSGHTLEVGTTRYGEENEEIRYRNATIDQTTYVNIVLDELFTNPPPPALPGAEEI